MSESARMSDIIDQLELFSENVRRVMASGFVKYLKSQKSIGYTFTANKDSPLEVTKRWPEEDLVNGFLLPFRKLILKGEPGSWRQIGQLVETLEVPVKYKDAFRKARINLNEFLDISTRDSSAVKFDFPGAPETNREILNTFLNGYYSHDDSRYMKKLKQWRQGLVRFDLLEFEFINIIITVSGLSYRISEQINKPMIEFLRRHEGD